MEASIRLAGVSALIVSMMYIGYLSYVKDQKIEGVLFIAAGLILAAYFVIRGLYRKIKELELKVKDLEQKS